MSEWKDCSSLKLLAEAQSRGDEIEYNTVGALWTRWDGDYWNSNYLFRCRPKQPKMKKIVLREALCKNKECYWTQWATDDDDFFVCWLDTPSREIEVPDA